MKKATLTEDKAEKTPTGGVLVGKREGQTIIHNKGTLSGYLVGKTHAEGGIKAINKSTGQPLEMQGGEVVITAPAVSDNTKRKFEGKMMTNREILSTINENGGGVAFAKDGMEIPKSIKRTGASYKYGGKTMTDHEIYKFITGGHLAEGMTLSQIAKMHKVSVKELQKQVDMGMKAESEHTTSKRKQMQIVKDHLFENPKYYSLLKKAGLENGGGFNSKPFLDYYFQEIKDFLEEKNNIKLKEDYTFRYRGEIFTIDPFIKADKNSDQKIKSADFIIYDSEGEVIGEISFNPNNKNKFNANSDFFEWNNIKFATGGDVRKESLVRDSKSGNTPARDLNNYNDVLDLQADGMVGADSGLFADGGMMARGGATDVIVDNWNDIPDTFKKIILPKKIDWLPNPSNEGLFEIAKPFLDGDSLRPALTGINFDDNGITFTNSHILLTIPTTEHDYKGIYKKGSVKIDATYPNYAQVIPKEKLIDKILYIDILKLLTYCKVAKNYSGKNEITFKVNDSTMSFSPDYIIAFLTSLVKLTGNIFWNVGYQTSKQALLFDKYPSYELGKDIIGLIMPYINTKRTVYGTENKDKNAVLNVYYDFDDNEIRNADGSVVDLDVKPTKERAKRTPKTTPSKTSEPIGKFTSGEIDMFNKIDAILISYNISQDDFKSTYSFIKTPKTKDFDLVNTLTGDVFILRKFNNNLGYDSEDYNRQKVIALIDDYKDWKASTPTKETEKIEVFKLVGLSIDGTESLVGVFGATELLRNLKRLYVTFPERQNFPFRIYDINNNATADTLNVGRGIETPAELITYIMDKPYYKDYEWTNFFAYDIHSTSSTEDIKKIVEQPKPSQTEKPKRNFELERKYLSQRISDLAKELDLKKPILSNEEVAFYQREINSFILKLRKVNDAEMSLKPIEERVRGVYDLQITSFDKQYEETDMTSINALKSQLTKEEYFTVRTPEFKSFFGDWETAYLNNSYAGVSKVINPVTKEPQPVFHGTNVLFVNWKTYDTNNAHYFAVKREFSEFFATSWETRSDKAGVDSETLKKLNPNRGSFLLRCFIDVKNPIDFSRFGVEKYPIREFLTFLRVNYNIGDFDFWTNITSHSGLTQDTEVYAWQIIRLWQSFTKYVKVFTTYDGYIFYEYIPTKTYGGLENASLSYCAFDSNQIKFTNAYEFNALSNDSRFDLGGIL